MNDEQMKKKDEKPEDYFKYILSRVPSSMLIYANEITIKENKQHDGGQGSVYEAMMINSGVRVAVKKISNNLKAERLPAKVWDTKRLSIPLWWYDRLL